MKKDEDYKQLHADDFDYLDGIKFLKDKYNTARAHSKNIYIILIFLKQIKFTIKINNRKWNLR